MIVFKKVNVTNEKKTNHAVDEVFKEFDNIDILLCFARITRFKLTMKYSIEE